MRLIVRWVRNSVRFVCIVLLMAVLLCGCSAEQEFKVVDGILVKYRGSGGEVTIPEGVTYIGVGVFYGNSNLTEVVIPEGVTFIGDQAFRNCESLREVTIPKSVTEISDSAFDGCTSLTLYVKEGSYAKKWADENSEYLSSRIIN